MTVVSGANLSSDSVWQYGDVSGFHQQAETLAHHAHLLPRLATKGGYCCAGDGVDPDWNVGEKQHDDRSNYIHSCWGTLWVLVVGWCFFNSGTHRAGVVRLDLDSERYHR